MQAQEAKYEFSASLPKQVISEAAGFISKKLVFNKRRIAVGVIIPFCLVAACVYSIWSGQEIDPRGAVRNCVIIIFLFWAVFLFTYWRISRRLSNNFGELEGREIKITLTDAEMIFLIETAETRLKWADIHKTFFHPNFIFFLLRSKQWAVLPTAELTDDARKSVSEKTNAIIPHGTVI